MFSNRLYFTLPLFPFLSFFLYIYLFPISFSTHTHTHTHTHFHFNIYSHTHHVFLMAISVSEIFALEQKQQDITYRNWSQINHVSEGHFHHFNNALKLYQTNKLIHGMDLWISFLSLERKERKKKWKKKINPAPFSAPPPPKKKKKTHKKTLNKTHI